MSRSVPCPNPPGGHIVCDDHQLGVCSTQNGERVGGCISIPEDRTEIEDLQRRHVAITNWVLSVVLAQPRIIDQVIEDENVDLLRRGEYRQPNGNVLRFTLPVDIDLDNLQGVAVAMS